MRRRVALVKFLSNLRQPLLICADSAALRRVRKNDMTLAAHRTPIAACSGPMRRWARGWQRRIGPARGAVGHRE